MAKDYYQILGVGKNASAEEIKKAFRQLAHQHHPDKAGGNEQKFKEINEAYQVLSNEQKRSQYDQYGQTFEQARSQGGFAGFEGFRDFSDFASAFRNGGGNASFEFGDLGDVFGDLFGMGGGRGRPRGNRHFNQAVSCSRCHGNGSEPGTKVITCATCRGRGQVTQTIGFGLGFARTCPDCQGQGKKAEKNCRQCHGRGVVSQAKTIKVKIPAGIAEGQSIRLSGEGQTVAGGQGGDLYIKVAVVPSQEFTRRGYDIFTQKEISFSQAALGDKVPIKTVDGEVKLKIPEATQSGKVFSLKGRGVSHLQSHGRGDHLVEIIVKTPSHLSSKQKELLKELADSED